MKQFHFLLPLLLLALVLSGCSAEPQESYSYTFNSRTVTVYPAEGTIVDGLDVYRYTRTENFDRSIDYVIIYPNGGRYNWTHTKNGGHGGGTGINEDMYLPGSFLRSALMAGEPEEKVGNPILGLLLIALGALHFFCPKLIFHLQHLGDNWKFKDFDPSERFLYLLKVEGVIAAVVGLFLCFV